MFISLVRWGWKCWRIVEAALYITGPGLLIITWHQRENDLHVSYIHGNKAAAYWMIDERTYILKPAFLHVTFASDLQPYEN